MIRFLDALILAHTKLRTHRVRTGITIGIAGILFGLILACIFVVQGLFDSLAKFSTEGLNGRALVVVSRTSDSFNLYEYLEKKEFISEVEVYHADVVARKAALAKKYNVPYDAKTEDPSPVSLDPETKAKVITYDDAQSIIVQDVAKKYREKAYKPLDIDGFLKPYSSARVLPNNSRIQGGEGATFGYMPEGKEQALVTKRQKLQSHAQDPMLSIVNQSVAQPFINDDAVKALKKGDIPVIVPFDQAEKALGMKKLPGDASTQEKYDRLQEVRKRIGEVTAGFCYRNTASQQLVSALAAQEDERERNKGNAQYQDPALTYKPIEPSSCGTVEVDKDIRSVAQKRQAERFIEYQKELGTYLGEPVQHKVTVRAVGISGSAPGMGNMSGVADMVQMLLGSWLGYGEWVIPVGLLKQVPEEYRPSYLFVIDESKKVENFADVFASESYLVEFGDPAEARQLMKQSSYASVRSDLGEIAAYPYGSGMLVIEDLKELFTKAVLWALAVVGGIAVIILGSIIGRTVSEGRRESAIFRAIGARRSDIGAIYGVYALLLAIRVVVFALVLGVVVAFVADLIIWREATLAAQYAYAASDVTKSFHVFGVGSPYVLLVIAGILIVGVLASIIPIIRSARRNPINDMRDDT